MAQEDPPEFDGREQFRALRLITQGRGCGLVPTEEASVKSQALVLVALVSRAGRDGRPFGRRPTVAELGLPLGMKERTTREALLALKASGHVELERNASGHVTPRVVWPFPPVAHSPISAPASSGKGRGAGEEEPPPTAKSPAPTEDNRPHISAREDKAPADILPVGGRISTGPPGGYPQGPPEDNRPLTPLGSTFSTDPTSSVHAALEEPADPRLAEIREALAPLASPGLDLRPVADGIAGVSLPIFPTEEGWTRDGRPKLAEAIGYSMARITGAEAAGSPMSAEEIGREVVNRVRLSFTNRSIVPITTARKQGTAGTLQKGGRGWMLRRKAQ